MRTSYHTHSRWSDGEGEIADFVHWASKLGLDELGISDHCVIHPNNSLITWSIPPNMLEVYVEEVQKAAKKATSNLTVRLGIEMDYFPETEDLIRSVLAKYPFDYAIGSVHFFGDFPIDEAAEKWDTLNQEQRNEIIRGYWKSVRKMAESRLFDIAGHLDLTKKFGHYASVDLSKEISATLDAIADSGMVVELNTSGWHRPCKEQYPSLSILKGCVSRGISVVVTADAHSPLELVRDFDKAYALLREVGYTEKDLELRIIRRNFCKLK
ncbi:MAG: histidinol-phosphatase [Armatimonadota bacterium]|nr:histidinol-phosphatase [Armatimonadota bacterium]